LKSLQSLRSDIGKLQSQVLLQPEKNIALVFPFACSQEPHGIYGYQQIWISGPNRGKVEPIDSSYEIRDLTESYDKRDCFGSERIVGSDQFLKQYPTLQSWLASRRCPCGRHGANGNQPYLGETLK
jgi:hypothetical protein